MIFQHAVTNWETVQHEWTDLFRSPGVDTLVRNKLTILEGEMFPKKKTSPVKSSLSSTDADTSAKEKLTNLEKEM